MKNIINKITLCLALGASVAGFNACSEPDDVINSVEYSRLFRPTDFKASNVTDSTAQFDWECINVAEKYQIEVFANDPELTAAGNDSSAPTLTYEVEESPVIVTGLEAETEYSARIKAISSNGKESLYAVIDKSFKTKKKADPEPEPQPEQTAHLDFAASTTVAPSYTVGCITMNINNGNGKFAIDANTQYFGTAESQTKYTARLKTGGNSSSSNGITLVSSGNGTLTFAMRSSSGSAARKVTISKDGNTVETFTVEDANCTKDVTIAGEDAPKTVFHTYTLSIAPGTYEVAYDGGLNFYALDVVYTSEGEVAPDAPKTEPGTLSFVEGAVDASYTFSCVTLEINNGNGKFAIDGNSQYFGTAGNYAKYTTRMKTGSASGETNGITLKSTGAGKVTIAMRSSSSSAARKVTISKDGAAVTTFEVADANCTKDVTIPGEDAAKTVFRTYTFDIEAGDYTITYDGGVNFYAFSIE